MDIKIRFTKKLALILGGVALCGLIGWGCWSASNFKLRHEIKATCQNNCECFANVVDYRLTDEQVQQFVRFMKELQRRPKANALEFMDGPNLIALQQAFAVCQPPRVAPQQGGQANAQPQKKTK